MMREDIFSICLTKTRKCEYAGDVVLCYFGIVENCKGKFFIKFPLMKEHRQKCRCFFDV